MISNGSMAKRGAFALSLALAAVMVCACDIADEDRCPEGFVYNTELYSCELVDEDDTDTGVEPSDAGSDGAAGEGWGEICTGQEDCSDYEADYCLVSPFASDGNGYCTIVGCSSEECAAGFSCCDCTSLDWVVACIDDENAALAAQYGCECE